MLASILTTDEWSSYYKVCVEDISKMGLFREGLNEPRKFKTNTKEIWQNFENNFNNFLKNMKKILENFWLIWKEWEWKAKKYYK